MPAEAEAGGMCLQAEGRQGLSATPRSQERRGIRVPWEEARPPTPRPWASGSLDCESQFKPRVCGYCRPQTCKSAFGNEGRMDGWSPGAQRPSGLEVEL